MKTRYKLLEKYPSLPDWFEVGMEVEITKRNRFYYFNNHNTNTSAIFNVNEIENHPKYWQKVEDPILNEKKFSINDIKYYFNEWVSNGDNLNNYFYDFLKQKI